MKICHVYVFLKHVYTVSMVETRDEGFHISVGPIFYVGSLDFLSDEQLGSAAREAVCRFIYDEADYESMAKKLDVSAKEYGFRSELDFYKKSLLMTVTKTESEYEIQPFERIYNRKTEGSIPVDILIKSHIDDVDLGCSIRKALLYCR